MTKYCSNCVHYKADLCYRKVETKNNLVTGKLEILGRLAPAKERSGYIFGCTQAALYYKER